MSNVTVNNTNYENVTTVKLPITDAENEFATFVENLGGASNLATGTFTLETTLIGTNTVSADNGLLEIEHNLNMPPKALFVHCEEPSAYGVSFMMMFDPVNAYGSTLITSVLCMGARLQSDGALENLNDTLSTDITTNTVLAGTRDNWGDNVIKIQPLSTWHFLAGEKYYWTVVA